MAKQKNAEDMTGSTFADLYDIQKELDRQGTKPQGRPRKKVQRKPTTIHLTKEENTLLRRLHLTLGENLAINKSEIVGVAIEALAEIIKSDSSLNGARNVEEVKRLIKARLTA